MKKEWTMEILTALQWAKKGFIPNEGAEGTEQWTNCYYSAKAVYFKREEFLTLMHVGELERN